MTGDSDSGGEQRGGRQAQVVSLYSWQQPEGGDVASMAAHVAAVGGERPHTLDGQRDALAWAERCCERIARDAADEADRCAHLDHNDRRTAAAKLMADRVSALRYLAQTLKIAQQDSETRARLLRHDRGDCMLRQYLRPAVQD